MRGLAPPAALEVGPRLGKVAPWAWGPCRGFVIAGVSAYLRSMPGSFILIDAIISAIDDYTKGGMTTAAPRGIGVCSGKP